MLRPGFFLPDLSSITCGTPECAPRMAPLWMGKDSEGAMGKKEANTRRRRLNQHGRQAMPRPKTRVYSFRSQNIPTADGNPEQKTLVIATRGINLNRHFTTTQYAILPPPSCHARDSSIHRPSCPVPPPKRNEKKKADGPPACPLLELGATTHHQLHKHQSVSHKPHSPSQIRQANPPLYLICLKISVKKSSKLSVIYPSRSSS